MTTRPKTERERRREELAAFITRMEGMIVDRDGCWTWKGATVKQQGVTPVMRWNGKTVMVRRKLYELKHGELAAGMRASYTCSNPACVHPNHIKAFTLSDLRRRDAETRNYLDPVWRTKQQKAKLRLPEETVAAIRGSNDPIKPLAKKLGVSQYAVWSIRNNWVRRDFMSVTGGLGGRVRNKQQEGVRK